MKTAILLLFCLSAIGLRADPIKLDVTVAQAIEIADAITALDAGHQVEIKQGSEASKVVSLPYDIDGKARIALAHDLAETLPYREILERARRDSILKISAGAGAITTPAQAVAFDAEMRKAQDAKVPITVTPVHYEDFRLEHNDGLVAILAHLQLIIEQPPK